MSRPRRSDQGPERSRHSTNHKAGPAATLGLFSLDCLAASAKKETNAAERISPTAGHLGSATNGPAPVCVACRTHRKLGREYLAEQEKT